MNEVKTKDCIICEKSFEYNTQSTTKKRWVKSYRSRRDLTCSKLCARIHKRIYGRLYKIINRKFKKEDLK